MKVVSKFALAFFAASALCLALFSYLLANREAARLERLLGAGLSSYGEALRPTIEAAWREDGYDAAERIVLAFDPEGAVHASLKRSSTASVTAANVDVEPFAEKEASNGRRRILRQSFPINGPSGKGGGEGDVATLTLSRAIVDGPTIIRDELSDQLLATGALAVLMAALAAVLGGIVIGGPLNRIVAQARRIGAGDLSQRLRATGSDEIGVLKRELNAMCDRLVEANMKIEEEASARIETLERLRHLDRLRTVGTIASGIAHELGTPLNILLLRGQSLAQGDIGEREIADAGSAVVSQVQKMSTIVRQLLDFARVRGAQESSRGAIDPADVARHASSLLTSMAKKHGVSISIEAVRGQLSIYADFRQIEQALTNLIVNGIQAMPKGGRLDVRVGVFNDESETEAGRHQPEKHKRTNRTVVIEVSDEGDGLADDVRERVFDPFFTTKLDGEGTGLGLHVARGIAEDHGGSIRVSAVGGQGQGQGQGQAQPRRGTTFSLLLPENTNVQ